MRDLFLTCLLVAMAFIALPTQAQLPGPLPKVESFIYGTPSPGHLLITPRSRSILDTIPGSLMICDSAGNPIWHFTQLVDGNFPYQNPYPVDFKLLNDSTLAYCTRRTGDYAFHFLDTSLNLIDTLVCDTFDTDEHEMIEDLQGNRYFLCLEEAPGDCSGLNTAAGDPGNPNCTILYNRLVVQDRNGNELWDWKTIDHIPIDETSSFYYFDYNFLDHAHTNSIAFDLDSNLILSHRNNFQIMKIERWTGRVMWRFGGMSNEFTVIGDSINFTGQHDAHIAPNGNLYFFDNGTFKDFARYVEYVIDTANRTMTLVREHRHPTLERADIMGGTQLLPDRNVLVCWGGNFLQVQTPKFTEFRPDGSINMEVQLPQGYTSYRAYKKVLPFQIERPSLTCDGNAATLTAPAGYQTYAWNTGATTQSISVSDTGTYQVWVNYGAGFVSSPKFRVVDLQDICTPVGTPAPQFQLLSLAPNPAHSEIRVALPRELRGGWRMQVCDAWGREIMTSRGKGSHLDPVQIESLPAGIYFIHLHGDDYGQTNRFSGRFVKH